MNAPEHSSAPAGWYADTATPGRQRWWDGAAWTDWYYGPTPEPAPQPLAVAPVAVAPVAVAPVAHSGATPEPAGKAHVSATQTPQARTKLYWWNLASVRFWVFLSLGPMVLGILVSLLLGSVVGAIVWLLALPLMFYVNLLKPFRCPQCGRVVPTQGPDVSVCSRCGAAI